MPRKDSHGARRKGRGVAAPLMLPLLTCAEEQTAAKKRAQDADGGCRPYIVPGVFNQDSANRVRSIENELAMAEKPKGDDIVLKHPGVETSPGHCRVAP
jgi:hypothetical protein